MISQEEVEHIAALAKIELTKLEKEKFSKELSHIFDWIDQLGEVNTKHTKETSQVTGLENVWRKDEISMCEYEDDLLECSPNEVSNHSIKIPKVL